MEHARTASHKTAPRKALACLLAVVFALSLGGAPVAYGAEAGDVAGPSTADGIEAVAIDTEPEDDSSTEADAASDAEPDAAPVTGAVVDEDAASGAPDEAGSLAESEAPADDVPAVEKASGPAVSGADGPEATAAPPTGIRPLGAGVTTQASETGLTYTLKDSSSEYGAGAYVTSYSGSPKDVTLPATLGGQPVVSVALQGLGLTSLDVSACGALKYLDCGHYNDWNYHYNRNYLTSLDVSACPLLEYLDCTSNDLASLNVGVNTHLKRLYCSGNGLAALTGVGNCTELEYLNCGSISYLDPYDYYNVVRYNNLTALDVSDCAALTILNCSGNRINDPDALQSLVSRFGAASVWPQVSSEGLTYTVEDGSAKYGAGAYVTALRGNSKDIVVPATLGGQPVVSVSLRGFKLTSLDVSACVALKYLDCGGVESIGDMVSFTNNLTALDVSACINLEYLDCGGNKLASLDVSKNTRLKRLDCSGNGFAELPGLRGCTELEYLNCGSSYVHTDVGEFISGRNYLDSLDVSGFTRLAELRYPSNSLLSLDASGCTALTSLSGEKYGFGFGEARPLYALVALDVSGCSALTTLDCSGSNSLTSLDVSGCASLATLKCSGGSLANLDVGQNPALSTLDCSDNLLSSLDVSGNADLASLRCSGNYLASLDVAGNPRLASLYCRNNRIPDSDARRALVKRFGSDNVLPQDAQGTATFAVSFDSRGGSFVAGRAVAEGSLVGALPVPAREGHTFDGWFSAPSGGAQVGPATSVAGDVIFYARWTVVTHTVAFRGWDGAALAVRTVAHGAAAAAPAAPARAGHAFAGWDRPFASVTSDLTVTAQYRLNAYAVTFKGWDGKVLATQTVAHGSAASAPAAPARTGHAFTGWDRGFASVTSGLTVTATYRANTYAVRLDAAGGKVSGKASVSLKRDYGQSLGALARPARSGHDFLGWYTAKSGGQRAAPAAKVARNVTYWAHWKVSDPVVTLNANGGKVGRAATASVAKKKGRAVGTLAKPARTGYDFQGWFTGKVKGTKVTARTKVARSVTYYAHWKPKAYTVRLDANGGKVGGKAVSSVKRAHGSKLGWPSAPTRAGYAFQGWYTSKTRGTEATSATRVTKNVTLYAHWKRVR
ncbi:MAG: InlB B-repeat-containing protein [Coriobacteriales bacterium]|jgi:uncharacterized repeat protein (TIGR02543 family)|nr:InlB B-repeat-containing protein [Coriobacteriales bacterium]